MAWTNGIKIISFLQDRLTAVLLAAQHGDLDLVEQLRADLLHEANVSSASFCV